jgi:hypothetical protein
LSPSVNTVPLIPTSRFDVASSFVEPQTAMSPAPTSTSDPGGGGGGEPGTVIDDVPVLPPADALIVAEPADTPVTRPLDEIVATPVFDDTHVNVVADPGGLAVAVNWLVAPAATVALDGETEIDLTALGCPPFANDGERVSVAVGADVSEHAANANAIPAAVTPAEPRRRDRVRIRACLSVCW